MKIKVDPKQVAVAFLWVAAVLAVINSVLLFFYFYLGDDKLFGLIDLFDFDIEGNVPTLYSALSILFCAALLALITRVHWHKPAGKRFYWLGLTILFVFLAIDEGAAIHEEVSTFLERYMDARGALYFLWVVPYGIAVLVLGLAYLKFVWELPRDTRARFVTAGVIFLTGALGIEMLGAREAAFYGTATLTYCLLYSLEEMLEMLGIIVFIYALLSHLAQETGRVSVVFDLADDGSSPGGADVETRERQS
ncbi:MAG: peptidase M48 Ste24p [Gammaproteobacteria bacterium]|nr:peptidase M48 Ste24p [Gammaproteobacteria bacterium]